MTAFDEATGKPKRDPLAWRLQKSSATRSKTNISIKKYSSTALIREDMTASLYGSQSKLGLSTYNN